jgi:hypothetical protein
MPKQLIFDIFKGSVRDSEKDKVDLESIYQFADESADQADTAAPADINAAPQETMNNEQPLA